jgi:L-threonylcarbamoyladenylate synthase
MDDQILQAVETLKAGGVILLPTETVYGIAADARSKSAIEKIYSIKGREDTKPLQVLVSSLEQAEQIAEFNVKARELARKFWPGALTIVLKLRSDGIPNYFNKNSDTVGIRIPNHPIALEILRELGSPLAATSANISGQGDNITFAAAQKSLGDKLDMLIDGGESKVGISSTVIDATNPAEIKILRQGSVRISI